MRKVTTKVSSLIMITLGAASLAASIIYTSTILAFIGLGLIFWGILLMYIHTEEHVKGSLLDTTVLPPLTTLNQAIREMKYESKAIYLPPKYFKDPETNKIYISKRNDTKLPTPEQIQAQETKIFIENPEGLLLTPPGAELARLFERTLNTTFTKTDVQYLQQKLPKLFIEDLEIAQEIQIETNKNKINIKIEKSSFKNLFQKTKELGDTVALGSPLISALACAITKASGKLVTIENQMISENGEEIEAEYRMLEEETAEQ